MIDSIFNLATKGIPITIEPFTIDDVIKVSKELFKSN